MAIAEKCHESVLPSYLILGLFKEIYRGKETGEIESEESDWKKQNAMAG